MRPLHRGISGIDHIAIPVGDVTLGERFYADILGGDRIRRRGAAFSKIPADGAPRARSTIHFATGPMVELTQSGPTRIAVTVRPEDLLTFRAILLANGIPVDGPRQSGPDGHASLYFLDPFGNRVEIVTMGFRGDVKPSLEG